MVLKNIFLKLFFFIFEIAFLVPGWVETKIGNLYFLFNKSNIKKILKLFLFDIFSLRWKLIRKSVPFLLYICLIFLNDLNLLCNN